MNPLDATTDSISLKTKDFNEKLQSLKGKVGQQKKDLGTDINAKKKAIMVPQSNDPSVERKRRQYDDEKIKDLEQKMGDISDQEVQLDDLEKGVTNMSQSLGDLEMQKQELQAAIAKMGG